jgi:serine/tyrosine/threonine adenylyltransferase
LEKLAVLRFDNSFVRELPADPVQVNRPRQVAGAAYSLVAPTAVAAPRVVAVSREVMSDIGLTEADAHTPAFAELFAGNRLLPGMSSYAACYGGHQFGSWAGQLGDGRAISLGEVIGPAGGRFELQLKGAGPTPYSRTADGRAVMRSSVREFLCSEAMFHLGVPTTRALSLVATGEQVMRDMFYDGNARPEPGAIVCRVAPSFIRFGNFEILAARRELDLLRALADYTIATHFPQLGPPSPAAYAAWFTDVCQRTALLMVHWMRVGFVHGVMNTDNMSILGLTIDYGPYGWLEGFDPSWTPNTTDAAGRRYRYGAQPRVAMWNLVQLANALLPLTDDPTPLEKALEGYAEDFAAGHLTMTAAKLGLGAAPDRALWDDLFGVLTLAETDMTIFFRGLAEVPAQVDPAAQTDDALLAPLVEAYYDWPAVAAETRAAIAAWLRRYLDKVRGLNLPDAERRRRMNAVNPKYVLRNYLAQLAIDDAEKGDPGKVNELLEVLRHPYDEQPGREAYAGKRPEWARNRAGCSMLSCSS